MNLKRISIIYFLLFFLSCSSGEDNLINSNDEHLKQPIPIMLNCAVTSLRATDYGYESHDEIGLYVVNYQNNSAGELKDSGNHVDNMRFTYDADGLWKPDQEIYWIDEQTPADFYCYYPYSRQIDVNSYSFSLKTDQSNESNYKASDFLYGKVSKVAPTKKEVSITTKHVFSCAAITVHPGNGFTEESLANSQINVSINNALTNAIINLSNGIATGTGTPQSIIPFKDSTAAFSYKALLVPQRIVADNFITVTVNERTFKLKNDITFVGGKRYKIPVTVSKTSNGINVGIGAWEEEDIDYGGTAE